MNDTLTLHAAHWQAMAEHVRRHAPEEACGLLGGPPGQAEVVYTIENRLHSPVAYEMDARSQVEAMVDLETRGWDVVAIFHSHPAGPPAPSPSDVAQAYYPEAVYLIWSPGSGANWQARGYRIEDRQVREIGLEIAE